ncbi:hypothetical protein [Photorhabdus luminescens]|uniref:hypothetical protein n=1 Tax=Photorhabdus luminescens TaxID=29488 RepID=UPI00223FF88E|nr:hypothetical protein [Photorhabdus luminescens]MCW7764457.1 hypothetical protein [Photorhabdus luminescens subsp. venezuelensis]
MTKHVHAELMMQYAQDALKTDKPWLMWERLHIEAVGWEQCLHNPGWNPEFKYRRKPEMITIGKVSFPKPIEELPNVGDIVYFCCPSYLADMFRMKWGGSMGQLELLRNGFVHQTQKAARQHAEALIKISRGEF